MLEMQHRISMLIVEDEMSTALDLEMLIEELGYHLIGIVDNAEEALVVILKQSPDLILMDIGIRGQYSGLEIAEKIKHLPSAVLFITSYDNQEIFERAKLTNFAGYLTKPVNKISIQGAVEMAIKFLHSKTPIVPASNQIGTILTSNNPANKEEDIFITKLKKLINNNLDRSDLTIEYLAKGMRLSRMQLYRKVKALTNQTTSELIRNVRLGRAFKLLKEQQLNVSEIAYKTGFSSVSHFSRAFKRVYGIPPSKVRK